MAFGAQDAGGPANAGAPAGGAAPALPPAEAFFAVPDLGDVQISPSGRWLALVVRRPGHRASLAVQALRPGAPANEVVRFTNADVTSAQWADDERIVFTVDDLQADPDRERRVARLQIVHRDGRARRVLHWSAGLLAVVAAPAEAEGTLMLGGVRHDHLGEPVTMEVWRQGVHGDAAAAFGPSGTGHVNRGAPLNVMQWLLDPSGQARLAVARRGARDHLYWREPGQAEWRALTVHDRLRPDWEPAFVDGQGQLFVTVPGGADGVAALHRFDFAAGRPTAKPLLRTPGFDANPRPVFDGETGRLLGLRTVTDAELTVWFEPALQRLQDLIDERLPGRVNRLSCRRCGHEDIVLHVYSFSDQEPGEHWVYRVAGDELRALGRSRRSILPQAMGRTTLHRIQARDGRDLPVWVTRPPGTPAPEEGGMTRVRPAVVLVHGGPWVRGRAWAWDDLPQFLASRGWVVIEPEFRGSTGYGRAHFEAGWGQWGAAMQDDLLDAVDWASRTGLVDPSRVCLAGASYGGYATLMGLIRHPAQFRCGAAWVAVTDPRLLFRNTWRSDLSALARVHAYPRLLGDPSRDAEALARVAPVERAGEIRAPVFLAFGELDARVPLDHGTRMRSALQRAGRAPEWIVYRGEGHGGWSEPIASTSRSAWSASSPHTCSEAGALPPLSGGHALQSVAEGPVSSRTAPAPDPARRR
jgi:dipeptidyl aminopeptidase/acylaminoacyl peptidase